MCRSRVRPPASKRCRAPSRCRKRHANGSWPLQPEPAGRRARAPPRRAAAGRVCRAACSRSPPQPPPHAEPLAAARDAGGARRRTRARARCRRAAAAAPRAPLPRPSRNRSRAPKPPRTAHAGAASRYAARLPRSIRTSPKWRSVSKRHCASRSNPSRAMAPAPSPTLRGASRQPREPPTPDCRHRPSRRRAAEAAEPPARRRRLRRRRRCRACRGRLKQDRRAQAAKAREGKALYDTLEQEMASLLGRPPGKT